MTQGGSSAPITKSNPIAAWFQNKKNKKAQKREEAAKMITNNKAENEINIANVLKSINFTDSLIPAEKLDYKTNENQPYGDLEFGVMEAIDLISNNTQDYGGLNINKIDTAILQIAKELKNAIEAGNVNRAFAAKSGLIVAIDQIRDKIPSIPESMRAEYIETSVKYLEIWTTLISSCTSLDVIQQNLDSQKQSIEQRQKKNDEEKDELSRRMLAEPAFKAKMETLMNDTFIGNSSEWDNETMNLYNWLVRQRIEKSSINFEMLQYDMLVKQSAYQSKIIGDYQTRVRAVPVPTDPNLMNKYKEMVEEEYLKAAEIDAQFDELGEYMDNMDERLRMMANTKGSIRMKRMALESVEDLAERARKIQMEEAGIHEGNQMDKLRKIKLLTPKELEKIREEQPEPEQQINLEVNKTRERIRQ